MPVQNPLALKEKIFSILRIKGPSIPARIARETELSILFASAFLSELLSEQKIKISNMKFGGSPIYFVPGQEHMLENFSQHLGSKEREAFALLKEKKFLVDLEQLPAIRVALRSIKDFAVPFKKGDETVWRYFTVPELELPVKEIPVVEKKEETIESVIVKEEIIKENEIPLEPQKRVEQKETTIEPLIEIREVISEALENSIKPKKKEKKKTSKKNNEKFFEKVKEFLASKSFEIINVESFGRGELVLRIKEDKSEFVLVALNKKRLNESDIIKAHKRALSVGLKYRIMMLGEPNKNLENLISASKELEKIEKLE